MIKLVLNLLFVFTAFQAHSATHCDKAQHVCMDPNTDMVIYESMDNEFCTINAQLSADQIKIKLGFYQICNELKGIVFILEENKTSDN